MSTHSMTPLSPDEALHAFMDGELDLAEEQRLFDELAANPDLRTEMKDVLSLRTAVLHDLVAPPAAAEFGVLSAVGLPVGAGAAALSGTAAATTGVVGASAAATTAGGVSAIATTLYAVGSLVAGFVLAWLLFSGGGSGIGTGNTPPPVASGTAGDPQLNVSMQMPVDTVYEVRIVKVRHVAVPGPLRTSDPAINAIVQMESPIPAPQHQPVPSEHEMEDAEAATMITTAAAAPHEYHTFATPYGNAQAVTANKPGYLSPSATPYNGYLRLRSLASGLHSDEPTPLAVQEAVLPNSAFAFIYPINYHHRVGIEMGTESFRQEFTTIDVDGREQQVLQTPVLFWMGGTYEVVSADFDFLDGLAWFGTASAGYAYSQGPVGRLTTGFTYSPVGPLRFSVGLDMSALAYQHQTNWFMSNKWGISYGISFDVP